MVASYPTIVRKFTARIDGTEYVMAADVNGVYDEVTAIETTLGSNPQNYNPPIGTPIYNPPTTTTTYGSVGARLDVLQQAIGAQQAQINALLADSQTGWALPVASVVATGTSIPPTVNYEAVQTTDWHSLQWTASTVDTNGVFGGPGNLLTIVKAGWWIITCTVGMLDPSDLVTIEHILWARIHANSAQPSSQWINMVDLGQGDSQADGEAGGYHRITMATGANFNIGDTIRVDLRHAFLPADESVTNPATYSMSAAARIQLTYIRGLPTGSNWGTAQLPYETGN